MMNMTSFGARLKRWAPLVVLGTIPFISACSDSDDPTPLPSIVDIAASTDRFSSLATAVTNAGLLEALDDDSGNYTVFAPNNDAFSALISGPVGTGAGWTELSDIPLSTLYAVLRYHVLDSRVNAAGAIASAPGDVTTIGGEDISLSLDGSDLKINTDTTVIATDIEASNGIIHEIDGVLLPTNLPTENIPTLAGTAGLTSLLAAVGTADGSVVTTLSDPTLALTVFAPTDQAFTDFLASDLATNAGWTDLDSIPDDVLTKVLNYHVLVDFVPSEDALSIAASDMPMVDTALADSPVSLSLSDELYINNAAVTSANNLATNGVVHVIDKVLIPPEFAVNTANSADSIAAIATASASLSTLLAGVVDAGLDDELSGDGTFTVFAPTDAAFAAAGLNAGNIAGTPGLEDILLQHVLPVEVSALAAYAANGSDVPTLRPGVSLTVEIVAGELVVEGSTVTTTDIDASNGVVHLIDAVILTTD